MIDIAAVLARIHERAPDVTADDYYVVASRNDETWVYVNEPPRDRCPDGGTYTTHIVRIAKDGTIVGHAHYRVAPRTRGRSDAAAVASWTTLGDARSRWSMRRGRARARGTSTCTV